MKKCLLILCSFLVVSLHVCVTDLEAQETSLEGRVGKVEAYLVEFEDRFQDFGANVEDVLADYGNQIEDAINSVSHNISVNTENRIRSIDYSTIELNPLKKAFHRIDTNTGVFLVSVKDYEYSDKKLELMLEIGNPNYMNYKGAAVTLFWGPKFGGGDIEDYNTWRKSLKGSEFTYEGSLEKGSLTPINVVIDNSVDINDLHLECSMKILSIEF